MGKRYLSLGGHLTLIKSMLTNSPTYSLSLFEMPIGILRKIKQLFRSFLWGEKDSNRKVNLVSWEEATKSNREKLCGPGC